MRTLILNFFTYLFTFLLALLFSASSFSQDDSSLKDFSLTVKPAWVAEATENTSTAVPKEQVADGIYHRFYDRQIYVSQGAGAQYYFAYSIEILNETGLEDSSQISVSYDPSYEQLQFHQLEIVRNGQVIDKSDDAQFRVLQREQELDALIYDGVLSASLILSDIRVGDTLRYAYTMIGDNPIYGDRFHYSSALEWSVPVEHQRLRLLWDKDDPVNVSHLNGQTELKHKQTAYGKEYSVEIRGSVPKHRDSESPGWFSPWAKVQFHELTQWSEVVEWALPLYQVAYADDFSTLQKAAKIELEATTPEEKISAALQSVQADIRYFGLEMGTNSHEPSAPSETWERRFGDCKDKTVALIALLETLGFNAYPALVNTYKKQELEHYGPTIRAFNHVIVTLEFKGETLWLDPTRNYQVGVLPNIYQPDYGLALIIKAGETDLRSMGELQPKVHLDVVETFALLSDLHAPVKMHVSTRYLGAHAESQRADLASKSLESWQNQFEQFYANFYSGVRSSGIFTVEDQEHENIITLVEDYEIDQLWKINDAGDRYETDFYYSIIRSYLTDPDVKNRNSPFAWSFPVNARQRIELHLSDDNWSFNDSDETLDNEFFKLSVKTHFNEQKNILYLDAHYLSKVPYIAAEKTQGYLDARDKAFTELSYGLYNYGDLSSSSSADTDEQKLGLFGIDEENVELYISVGVFILLLVLFIAGVVLWLIDENRPVKDGMVDTYKVPLWKFVLLSLATVSFYSHYYCYRLWKDVKCQDKSDISPIWRAIFSGIWFGPLAYHLLVNTYSKTLRWVFVFVSTIFAVMYVLISFSFLKDELYIYSLLASVLVFVPVILWKNHSIDSNESVPSELGRMRLHHYLVLPLCLTLLAFIFASNTLLIPPDSVVSGKELPRHLVKFMQRKKIVEPQEQVLWFSSDAVIDWYGDGNGFTNKKVFSYWKEAGSLSVESADFTDVDRINVRKSNSEFEDTVITIVRHDGSEFLLYVSAVDGKDTNFIRLLRRVKLDAIPAVITPNALIAD
ncbi:MAG: hypothetical protein ACI93R_002900 [Flavobacteriales bacterium]|jgi:hypothetical protein